MIFQVVRRLKGQKMAPVCRTLSYYYGNLLWSPYLYLWYICMYKKITSPGIFKIFFKILIFGIIRGEVKGQKTAQNDNKFCLSHSMSQELYIMWLWFLVHMCKMMISAANFFHFSKFWFLGFLRGVYYRVSNIQNPL